jgi:hypothetical protein
MFVTITVRYRSCLIFLALCAAGFLLSCIYSLRTEYVITAAQPRLVVDNWVIRPKIISTEIRKQSTVPDRPEEFALSFWASRSRSPHDTASSFDDLGIDSLVLVYPPGTSSRTMLFNEAAFVSYRAVSPDSIVKRFSIVNPETHRLIWHPFPKDAATLMLRIYVHLTAGELSLRRDASGIEFDTILPAPGRFDTAVLSYTELATMVVRVDRRTVAPGLLNKF